MGYNCAFFIMSREVISTSEFVSGDRTEVTVSARDTETGEIYTSTRGYDNDTWHTDSDRDMAHQEATQDALTKY